MTRAEKRLAKIRARSQRTKNFEGQERGHVAFKLACAACWRASAQIAPRGSVARIYGATQVRALIEPLWLMRIDWQAFA